MSAAVQPCWIFNLFNLWRKAGESFFGFKMAGMAAKMILGDKVKSVTGKITMYLYVIYEQGDPCKIYNSEKIIVFACMHIVPICVYTIFSCQNMPLKKKDFCKFAYINENLGYSLKNVPVKC